MKRLSVAVAALALASGWCEVRAEEAERVRLTFQPGQVTVTRDGAYDRVDLTGVAYPVVHPESGAGLPDLPSVRLRVALPAGASLGAPRLEGARWQRLPGRVLPAPVQPPQPLRPTDAFGPPAPPVAPDRAAYASSSAYPAQPARLAGAARMGGQGVAFVEVTPLALVPASGELSLCVEMTLVVPYTPAPGQAQPDARTVAAAPALVANPTSLVASRPQPPTSPVHAPLVILTDDYRWERAERGAFVRGAYVGDMAGAFAPLAADHTALGMPAEVVRISDVVAGRYGDFSHNAAGLPARDLSELLRNFMQGCAYPQWGTRYLLLGGDTDIVPTRHVLNTGMDWHYVASDWSPSDPWNALSAICRSWWPGCDGGVAAFPSGPGVETLVDGDVNTGWAPPSTTPRFPFPFPQFALVVARLAWPEPIWPAYNRLRLVWDGASPPSQPLLVYTSSDGGQSWSSAGAWPAGQDELVLDRDHWVALNGELRVALLFPTGWPQGRLLREVELYGAQNTAYPVSTGARLLVGVRADRSEPFLFKSGSAVVPDLLPFDPSASETSPGWYYVSSHLADGTTQPSRLPTRYIMLRGPAAWLDGATQWAKAVSPVYYATDAYFGDLEGNEYVGGTAFDPQDPWHDFDRNRDGWYSPGGDGIDAVFEVGVGRAPVDDEAQARRFVEKVRTYLRYRDVVSGRGLGDFGRRGLLGAYKLWGGAVQTDEGYTSREFIMNAIWLANDPTADVARHYEHPDPFPGALPVSGLQAAFSQGYNQVGLLSHSGPDYNAGFRPADALATTNAPYYSVVFTYGCSPNAFDLAEDSVSEGFLNAPAGGACAFVGNTRYGWSGDNVIENAFWSAVGTTPRLGDMLHAREARSLDSPWLRVNLLGDPALPVWQRVPEPLAARAVDLGPANGNPNGAGPRSYRLTVTSRRLPVAEALVAVSARGRLLTTALTDAQGQVTFTVHGSTTDPAALTIGVSAVSDAAHPGRAYVPQIRSLASLLPMRPAELDPAMDVR